MFLSQYAQKLKLAKEKYVVYNSLLFLPVLVSKKEDCGSIYHLSFEDVFKTDIYQKWKSNLTISKVKCLKCPAIYICGGGCPKQSESLFGNQKEIDKPFCIHTKYALKELFKRSLLDKTRE